MEYVGYLCIDVQPIRLEAADVNLVACIYLGIEFRWWENPFQLCQVQTWNSRDSLELGTPSVYGYLSSAPGTRQSTCIPSAYGYRCINCQLMMLLLFIGIYIKRYLLED